MALPEHTNRYIAVLVYESSSDAPGYPPLYEESLVLVVATDAAHARSKAEACGLEQQTSYRNEIGEEITWSLKHVLDVAHVLDDELVDGAELYARFFRNYAAYRQFEPMLSNEDLEEARWSRRRDTRPEAAGMTEGKSDQTRHRARPKNENRLTTQRAAIEELRDLPATVDLMTAARILGLSRTKTYNMARQDEFPCPILKFGDTYRIPTVGLLRLVGVEPSADQESDD